MIGRDGGTPVADRPAPGRSQRGRRVGLGAVLILVGVTWLAFAAGRHSGARPAAQTPAARTQRPGAVDIGFCQDMVAHHTQAILMADDVLTRADPPVRSLALSILAEQSQESGTLKGWLTVWNEPQLPSGAAMTWLPAPTTARPGAAVRMSARMPGMASRTELDRLTTATGHALDVDFLQLMIRHHQGGIAMAAYAAAHAATPLVRAAAGEMVLEQTTENEYMLGLLRRLGSRPLA